MVLAFFEEPPTSGDYVYPRWAHMIGWVIALVPVAVIPFAAVCACIFSEKRSSAAAVSINTSIKNLKAGTLLNTLITSIT